MDKLDLVIFYQQQKYNNFCFAIDSTKIQKSIVSGYSSSSTTGIFDYKDEN